MSNRPVSLLLADILEAIEKIERYTAGMDHDAFVNDDKTVDSVVRNIEIIGEASKRLPEDFKTAHPEIEWRKIVGLRNRIVHGYFGIDLEIIWEVLRRDLPLLKERMRSLEK